LVLAIGCALLVLAFAIFLYRRGASFAAGLVPAIAGLWSAGVLAPATQEVSGGIDSRIFWYAALISVAALQMPVIDILRLGRDIIAFVMLLLAVKLCAAISACASFNRDIGELTQAVNIIPPSAPVFVALRPDL
jgi:hypothetical protein